MILGETKVATTCLLCKRCRAYRRVRTRRRTWVSTAALGHGGSNDRVQCHCVELVSRLYSFY